MARQRMFYPDMFTSRDFLRLMDAEKILWVALILYADDFGRGSADPLHLKAVAFPVSAYSLEDIETMTQHIAATMSLVIYDVDGESYYALANWLKWQRLDHPSASKLPPPPSDIKLYIPEGRGDATASKAVQAMLAMGYNTYRPDGEYGPIACADTIVGTETSADNCMSKKRTRFTPPTVEEVQTYCDERRNGVDAGNFVDFYSAKGWRIGATPMKDWRAAVRTWERRDPARGPGTRKESKDDYLL